MWYTLNIILYIQVKPMKKIFSHTHLPAIAAISGGIGLLLRLGLYAMQDQNGLLPAHHPFHMVSVLIALCAAVVIAVTVKPLDGSNRYRDNFPPSLIGGIGSLLAAACLPPVVFQLFRNASGNLDYVVAVFGILSIPCLLFTGYCQWKGKRPSLLFHGAICLFFALHMVCRYRLWSGNPQIEDYLLPLFGNVFQTLAAYYRTAFDAGMGRRRMLLFCGLMAVTCCLPSAAGTGDAPFFLAGAVWAVTSLCVLTPPPRHHKDGENSHVSA